MHHVLGLFEAIAQRVEVKLRQMKLMCCKIISIGLNVCTSKFEAHEHDSQSSLHIYSTECARNIANLLAHIWGSVWTVNKDLRTLQCTNPVTLLASSSQSAEIGCRCDKASPRVHLICSHDSMFIAPQMTQEHDENEKFRSDIGGLRSDISEIMKQLKDKTAIADRIWLENNVSQYMSHNSLHLNISSFPHPFWEACLSA